MEIHIEDLYKSFGTRCVLNGIDLEVHRGEMIATAGGSGTGKSTLLRLIIGLAQPDRGHVLVADHEARGLPLGRRTLFRTDAVTSPTARRAEWLAPASTAVVTKPR